ncbi:MAG TPA: TIR domain-containing protein [Ktedonobacteraceae bacterium]
MPDPSFQKNPTQEKPLLIGFLIDVSLSMVVKNLRSSSALSQKRLDGLREAIDDFVSKGRVLCRDEAKQRIIPLFKVFAYGFGFGNAINWLLGSQSPKVQDLLAGIAEQTSTITIDQLFENWEIYQAQIKELFGQTLGTTPMLEAFTLVQQRFAQEMERASYTSPPVLFVLSDGEPTDGTPEEVLQVTRELQKSGVFILSCYITDQDRVETKKLYGRSQDDWPEAAKLAFAYASILPEQSTFALYFREFGWHAEKNARMFAQVNQTELMKEFLQVLLSPLQRWYYAPPALPAPQEPQISQVLTQRQQTIRVFISYARQDQKYLANDSLLGYLSGLEQEGFAFWHDQAIAAGELWDEEIRRQMACADIALVLVSQALLNSKYCREHEIVSFIRQRKSRGLVIVPVILSACNWKGYDWLRETQFLPGDGKNVESDFKSGGQRKAFFLEVFQNLQAIGSHLKGQ